MPDILFVDGGRGQLSTAVAVLKELRVGRVFLVGIAKGKGRRAGRERLYLAGEQQPVNLSQDSPALHLIQQIRDEAHRFAISFHRKSRSKSTLRSTLDELPGIGPKRRKALLKTFGSARGVARATVEDLSEKAGIPKSLAGKIVKKFRSTARKKG